MIMLRSATSLIQRIARTRPRIRSFYLLRAASCSSDGVDSYSFMDTTQPWILQIHRSLLLAGAAMILGSSIAMSSNVLCEEVAESNDIEEASGQGEEGDPYANLPEEDEETDCTICKTFRQGPCRPSWRKLERCFKDNEGSEAAASSCTKYFMGHQECLSGFTNLYQLISLDLKQELVDDTEKAVDDKERLCWTKEVSDGFIDWSQWSSFCKDMGKPFQESLYHFVKAEPGTEPTPLWKKVPQNTNPLLVATEAKLPTEQDGMLLKFAYAVDQNGQTLGVAFHEYYGKILEQHKVATASSTSAQKEDEQGDEKETSSAEKQETEDPPKLEKELSLEFYILPNDTRSVQLFAFYTEDPTQSDESKKLLDVLLYKTDEYQLKDQC